MSYRNQVRDGLRNFPIAVFAFAGSATLVEIFLSRITGRSIPELFWVLAFRPLGVRSAASLFPALVLLTLGIILHYLGTRRSLLFSFLPSGLLLLNASYNLYFFDLAGSRSAPWIIGMFIALTIAVYLDFREVLHPIASARAVLETVSVKRTRRSGTRRERGNDDDLVASISIRPGKG